jgi:signal transduction histidine kinase
VWAVNPTHDTLDSLATYLGRFAQNYLSAAGIRCRLDVPLDLAGFALTAEVRHNVFLAFKEALNNVAKHARATEVRIAMQLEQKGFALIVADNGVGFRVGGGSARTGTDDGARRADPAGHAEPGESFGTSAPRLASGNGLPNMKRRLEEIGGCCEWVTAPGEGTRVVMRIGSRHEKR